MTKTKIVEVGLHSALTRGTVGGVSSTTPGQGEGRVDELIFSSGIVVGGCALSGGVEDASSIAGDVVAVLDGVETTDSTVEAGVEVEVVVTTVSS